MSGTHESSSATHLDAHTRDLLGELDDATTGRRRDELCNEIITRTLPVADRLAKRYRGRGVATEDLCQVARTALVQAMRRFHGSGENAFLAYAVPSIRGELRRYFRDKGWVVRPPRRIQEARLAINGAHSELAHGLGREPTDQEIAHATGLDVALVNDAKCVDHCYQPESIDRPIAEDSPAATVAEATGDIDPAFRQAEARVVLKPLLARLADRDRTVIMLRFFDGLTQTEVGRRVGISQMQVSRVEARILRGFREALVA
jgi:RNA polymerase sigma-B factor